MKRFILNITTVLLLFVVPVLIGEFVIRNTENEYSYKNRYLEENRDSVEMIILGSSRSYGGIDPELFNVNTFNMANSGQTLDVDYLILDHFYPKLSNLKCVILELSFFSFRNQQRAADDWFYTNYSVFMNISDPDPEREYRNCIFQSTSLYENYLNKCIRGRNLRCDEFGQGSYYQLKKKRINCDSDGKQKARMYNNFGTVSLQTNIEYLNKMIALCKEHQIRLIFVTVPVWHTFYESMDSEIYDEMQSIISDVVDKNGVEYYNFMNDKRFNRVDDFFMDGHHLTDVGAEEFSLMLVDTLNL